LALLQSPTQPPHRTLSTEWIQWGSKRRTYQFRHDRESGIVWRNNVWCQFNFLCRRLRDAFVPKNEFELRWKQELDQAVKSDPYRGISSFQSAIVQQNPICVIARMPLTENPPETFGRKRTDILVQRKSFWHVITGIFGVICLCSAKSVNITE
jgi:hypothetical protein